MHVVIITCICVHTLPGDPGRSSKERRRQYNVGVVVLGQVSHRVDHVSWDIVDSSSIVQCQRRQSRQGYHGWSSDRVDDTSSGRPCSSQSESGSSQFPNNGAHVESNSLLVLYTLAPSRPVRTLCFFEIKRIDRFKDERSIKPKKQQTGRWDEKVRTFLNTNSIQLLYFALRISSLE